MWISTDGAVGASTDTAKTAQLDQLTHKVYCTSANRTSCVSTATNAISHTKLFTFSTTTAPDGTVAQDVVWFGSANQTYASGMRLYNNTVTVYGDNGLFTKLRSYLDDLYARRTQSDYYDPDLRSRAPADRQRRRLRLTGAADRSRREPSRRHHARLDAARFA